MLTRVGDEHMGRFVREALHREGVDVSHVVTDPARLTASVVLGIEGRIGVPAHLLSRELRGHGGVHTGLRRVVHRKQPRHRGDGHALVDARYSRGCRAGVSLGASQSHPSHSRHRLSAGAVEADQRGAGRVPLHCFSRGHRRPAERAARLRSGRRHGRGDPHCGRLGRGARRPARHPAQDQRDHRSQTGSRRMFHHHR